MFSLRLFGGATIEGDEGPLSGAASQRHRLALLALLAAAHPGGLQRDKLLAYLWPEKDAAHARNLLNQAVHALRRAVGEEAIVSAGDELRLDADVLPCDLIAFDEALGAGELERAVELYAGPFLDGFFLSDSSAFERWSHGERERLAHKHASALERLAEAAEAREDLRSAVRWWRTLAATDRHSSRIALRLMRALAAVGDRAAAIEHARVHQLLLEGDLGVEPDPQVQALAERLRTEPAPTGPSRPEPTGPSRPEPTGPSRPGPEGDIGSEEAPSAEPLVGRPAGQRVGRRGRAVARRRTVAALAAASAALAVAAFLLHGGTGPDPAPAGPETAAAAADPPAVVAVLPFADMSDGDHEYFSDGVTEELLISLSRVPDLRVVSRTSVMRYKETDRGVREIGRELGATHVLEGSVRRSGGRVRISAQLIDTETDLHLWADSYDRDLEDIFAIQTDISSEIVAALRAALPRARLSATALPPAPTADIEAYRLYLQGRYLFHSRMRDPNSLIVSGRLLREALKLDPGFARAWAGLGAAYGMLSIPPYDVWPYDALLPGLEPGHTLEEAEQVLGQALALDPDLAVAHTGLGLVHTAGLRWSEAEGSFRRALEVDPQYGDAYLWYGILLVSAGRTREALDVLRKGMELDPLNAITAHWLADAYRNDGRLEESLFHAQRSVDLGMVSAGTGIYIYHLLREEWDEAVARQERFAELMGIDPAYVSPLVEAVRDAERSADAVAVSSEIAEANPTFLPLFYYYDLPEPDLVFDGIDELTDRHGAQIALWRMWEPQLTHLRNHPRFREYAHGRGLVEYWREMGWPDLCEPRGETFACR